VTEAAVRDMLGLADGSQAFELLELALRGEAASALDLFQRLYAAGADPALVVQDLLERVHWITRVKLAPAAVEEPTVSEQERRRGKDMATLLTVPALARAWQLLLKGLAEVQVAPRPAEAAEMVLVRLAHLSDLPTPAELVRRAETGPGAPPVAIRESARAPAGREPAASSISGREPAGNSTTGREPATRSTTEREPATRSATEREPASRPSAGMTGGTATTGGRAAAAAAPAADPVTLSAPAPVTVADAETAASPESFAEVAELFARRREAILHAHIRNNLHLVRFEPGRIEVRPSEHAPANLANRMGELLTRWTGRRWVVAVSQAEGEPTLTRQASAAEEQRRSEVEGHPLVLAVMELFPGATIETIHDVAAAADPAPEAEPSNGDDDNGDEPR
jgi:DNA polymerase-3 subunit gamma/tau